MYQILKNNNTLLIFVILAISLILPITTSVASTVFAFFVLSIGALLTCALTKRGAERTSLLNILFLFWGVYIIFALLQYASIMIDLMEWAKEENDAYAFYLKSSSIQGYHSIAQIFRDYIINNLYSENGGYYFYISALSYIADVAFDGNHIMLQTLGTGLFAAIELLFIYKILASSIGSEKAYKYTLIFGFLSPLLIESLIIHRDIAISMFYAIMIYLSFIKEFSYKTLLIQILLIVVLYYFRVQSGIFAVVFVIVSLLLSQNKSKWFLIIVMIILIAIGVGTFAYNFAMETMTDTNVYYEQLGEDSVRNLTTGLGRYVVRLPSPIKEAAQIVVSQMQFPAWYVIQKSNNIPAVLIGILYFIASIYWFKVFFISVISMLKGKIKKAPKNLILALLVFFVLLILNVSNLLQRRILCVFPLLFMLFVYIKEYRLSGKEYAKYSNYYALMYISLCTVYISLRLFI